MPAAVGAVAATKSLTDSRRSHMSEHEYGLRPGAVDWTVAGPITFGPDGILFVADNGAAKIFAVDVADPDSGTDHGAVDVENVDEQIAALLGCTSSDLTIADLAVHPVSHNVYLSVQRGRGDAAVPVLIRMDSRDCSIADIALTDVAVAEVTLADAPEPDDERVVTLLPQNDEGEELTFGDRTIRILRRPIRTATITDMAYVNGTLLVAGLSSEEFSSKFRQIPFPFPAGSDAQVGSNLEIFHVSHGKWETAAPIRKFVPYHDGQSILASYTCTPVVNFRMADLAAGTKLVGRTVAELGAVNQPLGMVAYVHDGEEHLLVANTAHGLVKIAGRDIDRQEALTEPKEPVGVPRVRLDVPGAVNLAAFDDSHVLVLQADDSGHQHLHSLKTASL
jgi:hypothetical protein